MTRSWMQDPSDRRGMVERFHERMDRAAATMGPLPMCVCGHTTINHFDDCEYDPEFAVCRTFCEVSGCGCDMFADPHPAEDAE